MVIIIDFDGTCVSHEFPFIGNDIGSIPILKKLVASGHKLILFTVRSNLVRTKDKIYFKNGETSLSQAVDWFKNNDIPLYGINENPEQWKFSSSEKVFGDMMIDDIAFGCPLKVDKIISARPFVDWEKIDKFFTNNFIYS